MEILIPVTRLPSILIVKKNLVIYVQINLFTHRKSRRKLKVKLCNSYLLRLSSLLSFIGTKILPFRKHSFLRTNETRILRSGTLRESLRGPWNGIPWGTPQHGLLDVGCPLTKTVQTHNYCSS